MIPSSDQSNYTPKKALIIDDSNIAMLVIEKALISMGYDFISYAKSKEEAIASYKNKSMDLVTLDLNMTELDSIQMAQDIFKNDPSCDIVIITEYNLTDYERTLLNNIKQIILKPVTVNKVKSAVENIIKGKLKK